MMRHCKICGNEFAIKTINGVYCSRACAKMGKKLLDKKKHKKEVENNREKKMLKESQSVARKASYHKENPALTINNYLPAPIDTCFSCPFMGWECRASEFPLCRKHSGNSLEFMRAYNVTEVYA